MEVHPLAELIPSMTDDEFQDLKADIEANGQKLPITIYEKRILDGRHRYRACRELGVQPTCQDYEGDEPAAFVLSLNVRRRDLTAGQRAAIAVEFLPELEKEARMRQGERSDLTSGSTDPEVPKDPHRARNDAGALVGVSGATVDRARRVKEQAPERFEEVKAGNLAVRAADNEIREKRRAEERKLQPPDYEIHTNRHRQLAEANKLRIEKAVGNARGMVRGLPTIDVNKAVAVATDEEIRGWTGAFDEAIRSIRQLKKQLEGNS